MISQEAALQRSFAQAANGAGESVDIVNAMPKLQAGFSGELRVRVNRTKPEQAASCGRSHQAVKEGAT
jgi:hypothetical protein